MKLKKALEEKREWRRRRERVKKLPWEYRVVFEELDNYMYKVCCAKGLGEPSALPEILMLFEESAARGTGVLAVTGTDVAAFCDGFLPED